MIRQYERYLFRRTDDTKENSFFINLDFDRVSRRSRHKRAGM